MDVQFICHVDDMDMDTISLGFSCFILGGMESHDFIVLFSVMTSLWSSDFQSPNSVTDFDLMPGMGCHRTIPYYRQPEICRAGSKSLDLFFAGDGFCGQQFLRQYATRGKFCPTTYATPSFWKFEILDSFCKNGGHSNREVASINKWDMNNLTSNIQTAPDYES